MNRRSVTMILVIAALPAGYITSYACISAKGRYVPKAWGAVRLHGGGVTLASKRMGEMWEPPPLERMDPTFMYPFAPLIALDRLFWHPDREETGERKYFHDYYGPRTAK